MQGRFAIAIVALGLSAGAAAAAPVTGTSFISFTAQSGRGITAPQGYTTVAPPMTLDCTDPDGCLLSAAVMIEPRNNEPFGVCTSVDGRQAVPVCRTDGISNVSRSQFPSSLQHLVLTPGEHTVTTQVYYPLNDVSRIGNWEVDYTLYGR